MKMFYFYCQLDIYSIDTNLLLQLNNQLIKIQIRLEDLVTYIKLASQTILVTASIRNSIQFSHLSTNFDLL